jgi:hypothetical protein
VARGPRSRHSVLKKTGLSPLGPLACNTAAPDEGNMYLLGKVARSEQKRRFLEALIFRIARSAFFMTEPAEDGGAGSDPAMMITTARRDGDHWVLLRHLYPQPAAGTNRSTASGLLPHDFAKLAQTVCKVSHCEAPSSFTSDNRVTPHIGQRVISTPLAHAPDLSGQHQSRPRN